MNIEEAEQVYEQLRAKGASKQEALAELATYLHPIALAHMKKRARALETLHSKSLPVRRPRQERRTG